MEQKEIKKNKILFVVGGILLLILVIGASFAYFQIVTNNNTTNTTISGKGDLVGQASLNTNITELKLNLTAEMMSKDNIGKTYYATETGEGVTEPTLGNGEYVLATASLTESDVPLNCTYSYDINISSTKPITDYSVTTISLEIIEPSGISTYYPWWDLEDYKKEHTATIHNLKFNDPQNIKIMFYVHNSDQTQDDLSGNEFTITITPKSGEEGFSCNVPDTLQESYSLTSDTDISNMFKTELFLYTGIEYVKVSDDLPTPENLNNAYLYIETQEGEKIEAPVPLRPFTKDVIWFSEDPDLGILGMVVYNPPPYDVNDDLSHLLPGLYFYYDPTTIKEITLKFPKVKSTYELAGTTDITNMTKVEIPDAEGQYYVKVSDDTLTYDEILKSFGTVISIDGQVVSQKITEDYILFNDENILVTEMGVVVYNPTSYGGMTFTESGIYLGCIPEVIKETKLTVYE